MYKTEVRCPVLHDLGQKLQDVLMHENLVYKALPSLTAHSLQSVHPWGNLWKKHVSKEMGNLQWILSGKAAAEISSFSGNCELSDQLPQ